MVERASLHFQPRFSQVGLWHGQGVFEKGLTGLPAGTGYGTRRRSTTRASTTSSASGFPPGGQVSAQGGSAHAQHLQPRDHVGAGVTRLALARERDPEVCVSPCNDDLDQKTPPRRQGWGPVLPLEDEVPECRGGLRVEGAACEPVQLSPWPHVPRRIRSGCPNQDTGHGSAAWFGADYVGRGGGHSAGYGPRFFFKAPAELPPGSLDIAEVER